MVDSLVKMKRFGGRCYFGFSSFVNGRSPKTKDVIGTCVCMYVCMYVWVCMYACMYIPECMHYTQTCMHTYRGVQTQKICMYIHAYISYVCTHEYTHTYMVCMYS